MFKALITSSYILLGFAALSAHAQIVQKSVPISSGKRLEIKLQTGGSLQILGWAKDRVEVECRRLGRDASDCKIDLEQMADGVILLSRYTKTASSVSTGLEFKVHVPILFNIIVDSSGGPVSINNIEGYVQVETGGGAIQATMMRGIYSLTTKGGDIFVNAVDGHLHTNTASGKIQINVSPSGSGIGLRRELQVSSLGGDLTVIIPSNLHGEVGIDLDGNPAHTVTSDLSSENRGQKNCATSESSFGFGKPNSENYQMKIGLRVNGGSVFLKKQHAN